MGCQISDDRAQLAYELAAARRLPRVPVEVRKLVYTTNAIESLNFQLRKVIKSKGHFPSEDAALKLLFLALRNVEKKWVKAARNWRAPPSQQIIVYFGEERLQNRLSTNWFTGPRQRGRDGGYVQHALGSRHRRGLALRCRRRKQPDPAGLAQ